MPQPSVKSPQFLPQIHQIMRLAKRLVPLDPLQSLKNPLVSSLKKRMCMKVICLIFQVNTEIKNYIISNYCIFIAIKMLVNMYLIFLLLQIV